MYKLRELEEKDVSIINKWRNNPELVEKLIAPFRYINEKVELDWFENYIKNRNTMVRCAIINKDEVVVGVISLIAIDQINQTACLHIMIGESSNRGKGAGTYAIKEILKHSFENLNLRRIELTVLENNLRAKNLYKKIGFVYEGTKRKAVYKKGEFINMEIYSILREEFKY